MSFKRIGDDFDSIKVQKKFRVSELLLEDIPEDEATLMKNGRFACLVCRHNPVFDTVAVLSIHRQGKKHLANARIRLEKLREDTELRQKRAHENYLKNSQPELDQGQEKAPLLILTQKRKELALNNSSRSVVSSQGSDQQVKQKNVPFFQSRAMLDPKCLHVRKTHSDTEVPLPSDAQHSLSTLDNAKSCAPHSRSTVSPCSKKGKSTVKTVALMEISVEERAKKEHIARLTRDGWIRDWNGKWKKDENVEFDSDEDEPPPIP